MSDRLLPITSLAAVGQLDLLKKLYKRVIIPRKVYQELTGANPTVPGATEVSTFPWIETKTVVNQPLVQALRQKLDPGEAAAIAFIIETRFVCFLPERSAILSEHKQLGDRTLYQKPGFLPQYR